MIGAEARGRRRLLFRQLGESADRLRAAYRSSRAMELAAAYAMKRGRGQARARGHLVELFGTPRLVADKYLGWLFLAPARAGVEHEDPDDPGLTQDCIAAYALLAGVLPGERGGSITRCRWSLEYSEHAVGRLLERSPKVDPVEVMVAAHDALRRAAIPPERFGDFWLPGRAGAFACHQFPGTVGGKGMLYVRARTWLDSDQLTDQYIAPEGPPESSLASLLLPSVLIPPVLSDEIKRLWGQPVGA